jgi:hypothetical protein
VYPLIKRNLRINMRRVPITIAYLEMDMTWRGWLTFYIRRAQHKHDTPRI